MTRGDLVTVSVQGDFGKPRPGLVIQANPFEQTGSVAILLLSGTLVDAPLLRITIEPSEANGLRKRSQIMIDKPISVRRDRVGGPIGRLDAETMLSVTRGLAVFLGIV